MLCIEKSNRGFHNWIHGIVLSFFVAACFLTLPWSLNRFDDQALAEQFFSPGAQYLLGSDELGRSLLWRLLLGGAISLGVGVSSAVIAPCIGVVWGGVAGYLGGRVDGLMMRIVDVIYGLPGLLLVIMIALAVEGPLLKIVGWIGVGLGPAEQRQIVGVITILFAIGAVNWLVMSRVIRGQVLSLREQPYIEAARALGFGPIRIMLRHVLPNLTAPIVVYATLTVPAAILQESVLSFLGIGIAPPLPSWGNLAAAGVAELNLAGGRTYWWLLLFPCLALGLTLLGLNLLGESLRKRMDPKRQQQG